MEATHHCNKCEIFQPLSEFNTDNRYTPPRPRHKCKSCVREWNRQDRKKNANRYNTRATERRKANKRKLIELLGGKCIGCGEQFPDCCYDFHHTDPSKKEFDATLLLNLCEEKQLVEIAKCVLFCANCHRKEHFYDERFDNS